MSPAATTAMGAEVLDHLQAQIVSAQRLLECILRQGAAVRGRDATAVLAALSEIQGEIGARERLEVQRAELLRRAAAELGLSPGLVTLEALVTLMSPEQAELARELSAQLRGLLTELAREHGVNRALMRQELAFLDHLVGLLGGQPGPGYRPPGGVAAAPRPAHVREPHRVLDLRA